MLLLFLFVISVVPSVLVLSKIIRRKDISFFDVAIVGTTIYFILIPYKAYYFDQLLNFNINNYVLSLFVVTCFIYLLFFFNNYFKDLQILNMTKIIASIDGKVSISYRIVYLCLIAGSMMLYKVANYSSMDANNIEENNQLYFGSDMPIYLRMIWLFVSQTLPILFIYTLKNFKKCGDRFKKILCIVALSITFCSYFLGPKTNMTLFIIFVLIYFYSIDRHKISQKKFLSVLVIFPLFIIVYFPISQSFRLVKQMTVQNNSSHSFTDVVDAYIEMSDVDLSDIKKYSDTYVKGRSLNVFYCFDYTNTRPFQGEGLLTYYVIKSLLPLNAKDLGVNGNILGDTYVFKGADVGESILTWFNADFRYIGIVMALFFYLVIFYSFFFYYNFFGKLFNNKAIILLFVFNSFSYCFNIECNPSGFFHPFYLEMLFGVLTFGILCKVFKIVTVAHKYNCDIDD